VLTFLAVLLSAVGTGFLSTLFPLVSAELAAAAVAGYASFPIGAGSVAGIAIGQTLGKILLYETSRAGKSFLDWRRLPGAAKQVTRFRLSHSSRAGRETKADAGARTDAGSSGGWETEAAQTETVQTSAAQTGAAPADTASAGTAQLVATAERPAPAPAGWRRLAARVAAANKRLLGALDRPGRRDAILLLSAAAGFPPLVATAVAAGVRHFPRGRFAGEVFAGRLVRFFTIAAPFFVFL
jgi:membrane protein YqaA with SNARE-associated domain